MSMVQDDLEDTLRYRVVVNQQGYYSLILFEQPNPPGWRDAGERGTRAVCLEFIRQVWQDVRPPAVPAPDATPTPDKV